MRKPRTRKERIELFCRKKGNHMLDIFATMTDREVKQLFEDSYSYLIKQPDFDVDVSPRCIRCKCEVEHHMECLCGIDRAVFDENDWKIDLEICGESEMPLRDRRFVENGYHVYD